MGDQPGQPWRGGVGGGGGRLPATRDLRAFDSLPSLAAAAEAGAAEWAAVKDVRTLCAAFNRACTLGMAPGQRPRDSDPNRADLLHRTFAVLEAAYLPLVSRLRDAKSCVMPLWACAKAGYWGGKGLVVALLQRMGRDSGQLMRQSNSQDHGNVWWSLSEAPAEALEAADIEGLMAVSADSLLRMGVADISPQACSNVLLACARLRHCPGPLLHHLTACLAAQPAARCQELANGLYALGELCEDCGHTPRPQDLQRLAAEVVRRLPGGPGAAGSWGQQEGRGGFIPQALSNMLLGCSKLGYADPALLRPLADAAGVAARRSNEQDFANSLYALGVLGCIGPGYAPAVECLTLEVQQRLQLQPDAFRSQELSNILYALALLQPERGHHWGALVELLAAECKWRGFIDFSAQSVSNSAWALEKLGYRDQDWFSAAVAAAVRPDIMRAFTAQGLSSLWYVLALVRHRPVAALLEGTIAASEVLRTQARGQACSNLLWSLANLGGPYDSGLVELLVVRLVELLPKRGEVNEQAMTNSLWALTVMGPGAVPRYHYFVERLLREVARRWNDVETVAGDDSSVVEPFNTLELAQLWQVQQELLHADGCSELAGITAGHAASQKSFLLGAMRYAAEDRVKAEGATSNMQWQVVGALGRLARQRQAARAPLIAFIGEEQQAEGIWGRVDVVVGVVGGRQIAVEVDGPRHFLANEPHKRTRNGSTQLRDRQLERVFGAGNVVSVPYWEWGELGRDKARQEEYLLCLLRLSPGGP